MHIEQASTSELELELITVQRQYEVFRQQGLQLDLTRGKPCSEQLDLSNKLDGILGGDYRDADGIDVRNYGHPKGLREARELFARILGTAVEQVMVGGNSSLTLMYQVVEFALNFGLNGEAWRSGGKARFICPVPGYDRHFSICEHLGIEMVTVAMTDNGPDMDAVEAMIDADQSIRGIWCVPRFSNPCGAVYGDTVVERIARLARRAAPGFIVMWDNAYAVHSLDDSAPRLASIQAFCETHNTLDNVVHFGSTSKISFAGAGIACLSSSIANIKALASHSIISSIGADKVNQLRHVRQLVDMDGVTAHMGRHAAIAAPRFAAVQQHLCAGLGNTDMGSWSTPSGGYFVSFESRPGLAGQIVALASDLGVKLTPAGATWPYGRDPADSNIRLAPTFPSVQEVHTSMEVFVLCVKLASIRQRLQQSSHA